MLENIVKKIKGIEVARLPIGDSILLLAGLGINDMLIPAASALTKLPIIATGPGIAILAQLPMIRKVLGATLASVISATAVAITVDQALNVRGRAGALVARLVSGITPTATAGVKAPAAKLGEVAPTALMSEQERRTMATLKVR